MPTYEYRCPVCGARRAVVRPMGEAGQPVACRVCEEAMRRVWSVPALIVRPHGYHLHPGERGYWDIDRAAEVSRIPSPDERSDLGAGAPRDEDLEADEYAGVPFPQPSEDGMQKLHEVARATFSESGSRL
jgi:putative FmdB family regulatory protein